MIIPAADYSLSPSASRAAGDDIEAGVADDEIVVSDEPLLLATIPAEMAGQRLDRVLAQLFPEYSRSRLQRWVEAGRVSVDGTPAQVRRVAVAGAEIVVAPEAPPEAQAFVAEPVELRVVYEDAALLIIDKPAGLVVHPAAGNWSGTLLNGLLHRYREARQLPRAGIVHRLDKGTSGLLVVARTLTAQTDLVRQLQARTVKRRYLALVWGRPGAEGTIDAPIGRDPRDRKKMAVVGGGKPARTHYETLAHGEFEGRAMAALQCDLETGRTHQIRVHCKHIRLPLVGDPVYGSGTASALLSLDRQALHARQLGLVHPLTHEPMQWQSPLPADIADVARAAGMAGLLEFAS